MISILGLPWRELAQPRGDRQRERKEGGILLKLSSSSVPLVPGLMYLKGAINADSILNFSGGETRDMQSQQEGSAGDVLIVLSIEATEHDTQAEDRACTCKHTPTHTHTQIRLHSIFSSFIISLFFP